jgi:hypothetical protein
MDVENRPEMSDHGARTFGVIRKSYTWWKRVYNVLSKLSPPRLPEENQGRAFQPNDRGGGGGKR